MLRSAFTMLVIGAGLAAAQDNAILKNTQFHGFISQGFLFGSDNNYLTTKSSDGSPEWTEGAVNAMTGFSDNFHAGVQVHSYRLGMLGRQRVELDWAYGDYRANEHFGFRVGRVKTALGLFNDTQDIDALHLWSLLPQGIYPIDNKGTILAHDGLDVYGNYSLAKYGKLSYTLYGGVSQVESVGGYVQLFRDGGLPVTDRPYTTTFGADLRWRPRIKGLTAGVSYAGTSFKAAGVIPGYNIPYDVTENRGHTGAAYANYEHGKFQAAAEFRKAAAPLDSNGIYVRSDYGTNAWYALTSYRLLEKWTVGGYYSHYNYTSNQLSGPGKYSKDWVASTRFDLNQYLYFKLEGHFINGTAAGLYSGVNPNGFEKNTQVLVGKAGFTF